MRIVPLHEKQKRGCQYCKDMGIIKNKRGLRTGCPHSKCIYAVLDKYDSYDEFMASEDSKILVDGFFQTVPSCYELTNGNVQVRKIYSGCESELHL